MIAILSSHKKIIIGVVVVVLLFVAYGIFVPKKDTSTTALNRQTTTSTTSANNPNSPGRQFVSQLLAIQNIHYNLDLFSDPAYVYLQDFSRELTPQNVGRENPFAPIGSDIGGGSGVFVTENEPTFINTSAAGTSTAPRNTPTPKTTPNATSTRR